MYRSVYPIHRRPLVVRTGVDYRFTALVVDQVDAVDGRYEVLFLGTGEAAAGLADKTSGSWSNVHVTTCSLCSLYTHSLYLLCF